MHTLMAVGREMWRSGRWWVGRFPDPPPWKYAFSMTFVFPFNICCQHSPMFRNVILCRVFSVFKWTVAFSFLNISWCHSSTPPLGLKMTSKREAKCSKNRSGGIDGGASCRVFPFEHLLRTFSHLDKCDIMLPFFLWNTYWQHCPMFKNVVACRVFCFKHRLPTFPYV